MKEWEKKSKEIFNEYLWTLNKVFYGSLFIIVILILIAQLLYDFFR